ncbi:sensor histidine kinase [Psychroserpens sp. MEBiC05023]
MNDLKYRYILYVIIIVILSTIGIQAYWNYKSYQSSKQQLINDVQASLDDAVNDYYANLAQETTLALKFDNNTHNSAFDEGGILEQVTASIDKANSTFKHIDSLDIQSLEGVTVLKGHGIDTLIHHNDSAKQPMSAQNFKFFIKDFNSEDSLNVDISSFEMLTKQVVISISNDSLNISKIDSLLLLDLNRKGINLEYELVYNDKIECDTISWTDHLSFDKSFTADKFTLRTSSQSSFLPKNSLLAIQYQNTTWIVLKRIIWGIIISTLLVLAVISCLFYLLSIIKNQKQLAEVKNDLISNITHEFKTPIATIGVALESIQNFNAIEDKDKTKTYLDMSSNQLSKLNTMVEKLLETASLDSDNLELNIDTYNISEVISSITEKHKLQHSNKTITCNLEQDVYAKVDVFHFENAINNLVDNAFKYGGSDISVRLAKMGSVINIVISDNGGSLTKTHKERIFEKFYRVPKGNTHDVKGFGIGLYYTKKIIEKHNGGISLDLSNSLTTFNITIPNV